MTRAMRAMFCCQHCGMKSPSENPFSSWVRTQLLDSRNGLTVSDIDYIFHRFHHHGNRTVQFMINVEVKTFGADVPESQRDTLAMDHQSIRTHDHHSRSGDGRVRGGTKKPPVVWSTMLKKKVVLNHLGWNLLQMSGETPDASSGLFWNKQPIAYATLVKVLQLDIHPRTFKPLTARRHKRESLPLFESEEPIP